MAKSSDKRNHTRFQCAVPVEGKKGTAFSQSQTIDISRGGVGLIVNEAVAVNTRMAVELNLAADSEPVLAMGQVRWVQRLPDSGYRLGIAFDQLEAGFRSAFQKYFK